MHSAFGSLTVRLRGEFDRALGGALDGAHDVVLLDQPAHHNVGDHLIWLGEVQALQRLGVDVRGVMQARNYDRSRLERMLGKSTVLLHNGGGNFGDLYKSSQRLRLRLLREFPDRRIVQLPQSVEFIDDGARSNFTEIARSHGDYRVMVRDRRSLERMRSMGLDGQLVPDAALTLSMLDRRSPEVDVLWLRRGDAEGSIAVDKHDQLGLSHRAVDWTKKSSSSRRVRTGRQRVRRVVESSEVGLRITELEARRQQHRGLRLLSQGRTVLTDRLHGSVLAALAGIPAVTMADRYGKIEALRCTWGLDDVLPPLVRTVEEAERHLKWLLEEEADYR